MTESPLIMHLRLADWHADDLQYWFDYGRPEAVVSPAHCTWEALAELRTSAPAAASVRLWLGAPLVLELQTELPAMKSAQLRERVPFAIEDMLAGDLDVNHIAIGEAERQDNGQLRVPVRVVAAAPLRSILQRLRDCGVEPEAVYAEADALPKKPGDLQLWLEAGCLRLRHPDGRWLMTPVAGCRATLEWLLAPRSDSVPTGEVGLWILGQDQDRAPFEQELAELAGRFAGVRWQLSATPPLPRLAARVNDPSPINLLQGSFAARPTGLLSLKAWRPSLLLTAVAVALLIAIDVTLSLRSQSQEQSLDVAIADWQQVAQASETSSAGEAATPLRSALDTLLALNAVCEQRWPGMRVVALADDGSALRLSLAASSADTPGLDTPPSNLIDALTSVLRQGVKPAPVLERSEGGWQMVLPHPTGTTVQVSP